MAAELEKVLSEESVLVQSSGGVFDVQDRDQLIYSKKETNRFPADGEVSTLVNNMAAGKTLEEARAIAAANVQPAPSFMEWLSSFLDKGQCPL